MALSQTPAVLLRDTTAAKAYANYQESRARVRGAAPDAYCQGFIQADCFMS